MNADPMSRIFSPLASAQTRVITKSIKDGEGNQAVDVFVGTKYMGRAKYCIVCVYMYVVVNMQIMYGRGEIAAGTEGGETPVVQRRKKRKEMRQCGAKRNSNKTRQSKH